MKKVCINCNQEMGMFTGKVELLDGWVCTKCFEQSGLSSWNMKQLTMARLISSENMRRMIKGLKPLTEEDKFLAPIREKNKEKIENFAPTNVIGNLVKFNDETKEFVVGQDDVADLFKYENIVDYELLENGSSLSKGSMGGALLGGALLGSTGAIIGATSKQENIQICDSLVIKLTLRDTYKKIVYLNFITHSIQTSSFQYKTVYTLAQNCMSLFKIACDRVKPVEPEKIESISQADELRKFKQLLDDGIITEEEFQNKKRQLLGCNV